MTASTPPSDEYLTLLPGGAGARSAGRPQLRTERGEGGELKPGRQQVKVGVAGGRRSGSGALRGDVTGDRVRVGSSSQTDREQSGRVGESLANELLEPKAQLCLVGAGRERGDPAPLLAQCGQRTDETFESGCVGMQQELPPDRPQRRRWRLQLVVAVLRAMCGGVLEALRRRGQLHPAPRVGDTRRAGDGRQRTQPRSVSEQPLRSADGVQPKGSVQNVRSLGANTERGTLKARRGAARIGAERIAPQQCREFVGGRERLRGLTEHGVSEGRRRLLSAAKGSDSQRDRHGVDRPVPIDEIRATRRRRREDRV